MAKRPDTSDLDQAALAQHRSSRDRRPRTWRPSTGPDLSRRNAIGCRFQEVLAARTPEELEAILEAREAEDARLDAELTEEQRLGLAPVGARS